MFPEFAFPPVRYPDFWAEVEAGLAVMRGLRVCILMLARDCADRLPATIRRVEATGGLFADWSCAAYENDSTDATPKLLKAWAARNTRVEAYSEQWVRKHWPMVRHPRRGKHMADYRNRLKQYARDIIQASDVVLLVDSDLASWSLPGLATTFGRPRAAWDWVAGYGTRYDRGIGWVQCDAWAYRTRTWGARTFQEVRQIHQPRSGSWVPVLSAFGGIGVYRSQVYLAATYGGGDCEHVILHRRLREAGYVHGYLNTSQLALYREIPRGIGCFTELGSPSECPADCRQPAGDGRRDPHLEQQPGGTPGEPAGCDGDPVES